MELTLTQTLNTKPLSLILKPYEFGDRNII